MKVFFRRIHLYLGLAAGLIIMNSCLTGMILVFQEEIEHILYSERYYVEAGQSKVSVQQMINSVHQQEPTAQITAVKLYTDPSRSAELTFRRSQPAPTLQPKPDARSGPGKEPRKEGLRRAFVHPYSGQILDIYSPHNSFFHSVEDFHRRLLGGTAGKTIVGISTLFFLGILITGLILWFPKTKTILKQRLKIKNTRNWKRVTHDFHVVLGFYTSIFLFIIAFTGLTMAFDWFGKGVAAVTRAGKPAPPPAITYQPGQPTVSFDQILTQVRQVAPNTDFYVILPPKDSVSAYVVHVRQPSTLNSVATDSYFLHPYTGRLESIQPFADKSAGQQAKAFFKPAHMGTVFGIYSKIIAFVVAFIGLWMPVTGTLMWWNRTYRKKTMAVKL